MIEKKLVLRPATTKGRFTAGDSRKSFHSRTQQKVFFSAGDSRRSLYDRRQQKVVFRPETAEGIVLRPEIAEDAIRRIQLKTVYDVTEHRHRIGTGIE